MAPKFGQKAMGHFGRVWSEHIKARYPTIGVRRRDLRGLRDDISAVNTCAERSKDALM